MVQIIRRNKNRIAWGRPGPIRPDSKSLIAQTQWNWLSIYTLRVVRLNLRQVKAFHAWLGEWIERQEKGGE